MSQYDYAMKIRQLQQGRAVAKTTTQAKSLEGHAKVEGRKNHLELHPLFLIQVQKLLRTIAKLTVALACNGAFARHHDYLFRKEAILQVALEGEVRVDSA